MNQLFFVPSSFFFRLASVEVSKSERKRWENTEKFIISNSIRWSSASVQKKKETPTTFFRKNLKEHQIKNGWWIKAEEKVAESIHTKRCQAVVTASWLQQHAIQIIWIERLKIENAKKRSLCARCVLDYSICGTRCILYQHIYYINCAQCTESQTIRSTPYSNNRW